MQQAGCVGCDYHCQLWFRGVRCLGDCVSVGAGVPGGNSPVLCGCAFAAAVTVVVSRTVGDAGQAVCGASGLAA